MKLNSIIAFAAGLLCISAVLHIATLYFHGISDRTIPIAVFGVLYFAFSVFIFRKQRWALYAAAVLASIGMILASVVYSQSQDPFPLDLPFIIVDIIIVPIFWYFILTKKPILSFKN